MKNRTSGPQNRQPHDEKSFSLHDFRKFLAVCLPDKYIFQLEDAFLR
jgi:hypothetical protein